MNVIVAIFVVGFLIAAGMIGGLWRLGGWLARRAERVAPDAFRAGAWVQRIRMPLLAWALVTAGIGIVLAALGWDSDIVRAATLIGAVVGVVFLLVIPPLAPVLAMRLVDAVRRRFAGPSGRR